MVFGDVLSLALPAFDDSGDNNGKKSSYRFRYFLHDLHSLFVLVGLVMAASWASGHGYLCCGAITLMVSTDFWVSGH